MRGRIELTVIVLILIALALLIDPMTPEGAVALAMILSLYVCYLLTSEWPARSRIVLLVFAFFVPGILIIPLLVMLWRKRRVRSAREGENMKRAEA